MSDRHRIQTMCARLPRTTLARVDEEFCCLIRIQGMTSLIPKVESRYLPSLPRPCPLTFSLVTASRLLAVSD